MTQLSVAAKQEIKDAGLTLRDYARSMGWDGNADGRWFGDSCGCSDDRCVGHRHDQADDPCGCLPVLIVRARIELREACVVTITERRRAARRRRGLTAMPWPQLPPVQPRPDVAALVAAAQQRAGSPCVLTFDLGPARVEGPR